MQKEESPHDAGTCCRSISLTLTTTLPVLSLYVCVSGVAVLGQCVEGCIEEEVFEEQ